MTHQSSSFSMPLLAWLILGSWLFVGCSESSVRSVDQPLFAVETWMGTWVGEQPEHAMRNANGEPILIRGKAATVKGSTYTFTINADGTAHLHQAFADGRTMTFAGKWRGQLDENQPSIPSNPSDKPRLRAVVFELAATDTGAYRQYVLAVDTAARQVNCIGTSSEPGFSVQLQQ